MGYKKTYINEVDRHFDCFIFTFPSLLYYSSIMMITIDRFMICHLSMNYSRYWNIEKTKVLMSGVGATAVAMYLIAELVYMIKKQDINRKIHLYFYIPFNGLFVITATTTYSHVFYKYVSSRQQILSYDHTNEQKVKATMSRMNLNAHVFGEIAEEDKVVVRDPALIRVKERAMMEKNVSDCPMKTKCSMTEVVEQPETNIQQTAAALAVNETNKNLKTARRDGRKYTSVTRHIKGSKFYVSLLLIATFFLFIVIPDLVYFVVIEIENSRNIKLIEKLISISYALSFICDGLIYIMLDKQVRAKLFKSLKMKEMISRSDGESKFESSVSCHRRLIRIKT